MSGPNSGSDPLQSPKLKIERAKALVKEVETRIADYTRSTACNLVIALHPDDEGQRIAIIEVAERVPVEIALIVGDAIHNARTALDHLACCLSVANGKSMKGVYFPFANDRAAYEAGARRK